MCNIHSWHLCFSSNRDYISVQGGKNLRPKVLNCVKLGNETQVLCPAFALVVFEIPQGPSEGGKQENPNIQYSQECGKDNSMTKYFTYTSQLCLDCRESCFFDRHQDFVFLILNE